MFGPPGRADVLVDIVFLYAYPVHGREVAHRIALMRVEHELGFGSRSRGEIKQKGIGRLRRNRAITSIFV